MLKKYVCLIVFLFSLPVFSATKPLKINNSQNPFLELENVFPKGDIKFSFNVKKINKVSWHAGRCFKQAEPTEALASLLVFLPNDYYKDYNKGPWFASTPRMWVIGSVDNPPTWFDNIDFKKEKEISNFYVAPSDQLPELKKLPNSLVSNRFSKVKHNEHRKELVLRHYNNYLIAKITYILDTVTGRHKKTEYCYYFKKVK